MNSVLRLKLPFMMLASVGLVSCSHLAGESVDGRYPASGFARACQKLSPEDQRAFEALVNAEGGIGQSLKQLSDMAHLLHVDQDTFQTGRLTMEEFMSQENGIMFSKLQNFSKILLGDCGLIRDGLDPDKWVTRKGTPKAYKLAEAYCGKHDEKIPPAKRTHPDSVRNWDNFDMDGMNVDIRLWVETANKIISPTSSDTLAPDKITDACVKFKARRNVEDVIENLFLCLDAFVANLYEYDWGAQKYVFDANNQMKFKSQAKVQKLTGCAQGYIEDQIAQASAEEQKLQQKKGSGGGGQSNGSTNGNGSPPKGAGNGSKEFVGPPAPPPPPPGTPGITNKITQTSNPGATPPPNGSSGGSVENSTSTTSGSTRGVPNGQRKGDPDFPACMPADADDAGCRADDCVKYFSWYASDRGLYLPRELSSKSLEAGFDAERSRYLYEVSRNQARLLGQGYVVAAYNRLWDSPKQYNDNIREFAASCSHSGLRDELAKMASLELIDERQLDSAYDPAFSDQRDLATDKGRRMVYSIKQILALRKLVKVLNTEVGADEVSILHYPKWLGYIPAGKVLNAQLTGGLFQIPYLSDIEIPIPMLHYMVDAPISISYGKHTEFQCNSISMMMADDNVPATRNLIKPSDVEVRRLFNDETFRKQAFCSRDGRCTYPPAFEDYLKQSDPHAFDYAEKLRAEGYNGLQSTIHLRQWCQLRYLAAQSLLGLEQQIISQYPALAHAELIKGGWMKEDKAGPPLFERLNTMAGSDDDKAKFALSEADRVLPSIQSDIKKYLTRVCDDLSAGRGDSTYMAMLNHQFLSGFDYCAGLSKDEQERLGLRCGDRETFLTCKMQHEADEWNAQKHMPEFAYQVAMAGMDALFIYSIASGSIASAFTPKGIITGGIVGLGFTGANYGVSYLIARNNEANWDDYNRGSAGLALEGVDSYANAITAIAASQPKPKLQDFLMGFVLGAMMSGKPGEGKTGTTPPETFAEVAKKVGDYAQSEGGGGVRFEPTDLSSLKDWLARKTADNPGFASELARNLGDALVKLSDADYQRLFESADGKAALGKVRKAMSVRLRQAATRFSEKLGKLKSEISMKKLSGKKLSPAEEVVDQTSMQSADLATAAESMGPRELASLADAVEDATRDIAGEKPPRRMDRLVEFVKRLCNIAVWCSGLQGLKGCPL